MTIMYICEWLNKTHNILEEKSRETNMGNPTETSQIILADQTVQEKWEALVKLEGKTQRLDMEIQGRILKLYITVRCFAFTKKTMEKYKQKKGNDTKI